MVACGERRGAAMRAIDCGSMAARGSPAVAAELRSAFANKAVMRASRTGAQSAKARVARRFSAANADAGLDCTDSRNGSIGRRLIWSLLRAARVAYRPGSLSARTRRLRRAFSDSARLGPWRPERLARRDALRAARGWTGSRLANALAVPADAACRCDERVSRMEPHLARIAVPDLLDGTCRERGPRDCVRDSFNP